MVPVVSIPDEVRRQLALLSQRPAARVVPHFTAAMPTDWRPQQVRNLEGVLDAYFTDAAAWELIADRLEAGHPVETVTLSKPRGKTGYVMKIALEGDDRPVYVKLQLGSGKVIGRSFHYSEHPQAGPKQVKQAKQSST